MRFILVVLYGCGLIWCTTTPRVLAQRVDTLTVALPEIEVQASRATETTASAPFAVAILERSRAEVSLQPGLSLQGVLGGLPGVWINDRHHDALGERLVIRGMGWRAAFGVRGAQVLLDGIPLTLPDGQTVLDVADPAFIRRAEVIRGPSSLFWGNASGGVLFLSTAAPGDTVRARVRLLGGSYGQQQLAGEAAVPLGRHRLSAFVSDTRHDGFRAHSTGGFTRAALHAEVDVGPRTRLRTTAALAVQDTEAPGALTAAQLRSDPRQADERFVRTDSGKESTQGQVGATVHRETSLGLLSITGYALVRRLDNPLPFAYIDLDRTAGGARVQLQERSEGFGWSVGADAGWQRDDRLNTDNDAGRAGTDIGLDQLERVRNVSGFGMFTFAPIPRLEFSAGVRLDALRFAMDDRLLEDGDQSGGRTFSAFSPAAGLSYRTGEAVLFAHASTAFETPTTTELVNRPDEAGGFNPDLDPQRTRGLELGARGRWSAARLRFDVALFHLDVDDRLLPFQNDEGRTFFRNAGANTHEGVELSIRSRPHPGLDLQLTYAGSRFVFDEEPLDENRIPGIPNHHVHVRVRGTRHGWRGTVILDAASMAFADDANSTENEGYAVLDVHFGYTGWRVGGLMVQPLVEIGNVFDTRYVGSLVVNASGGRYFEPAPGRTVQAGLNMSF